MDILLDFDGTCVDHAFPELGNQIGAVPVLKKIIGSGHNIILFTMRDNKGCANNKIIEPGITIAKGDFLKQAVDWFKDNEIPLYGIQKHPTQHLWTSSNKAYGHLIIDDTALGCPLVFNVGKRPYVDWVEVEKILVRDGIINDKI